MKPTTAENLMQRVADLELAPGSALHQAYREAGGPDVDAASFGQALVRRELLTRFQLDRLLLGETQGFFYGRAKLLYQVGTGSFARVYRAVNLDSGETVAVKVLRKRFAGDAEKRDWFQREAETGRLLRHPHIVSIEDVGIENGTSYITMEFVEGQTLRELTRIRGAIDVPHGLEMLSQLLSALDYAHRRRVTHRDLKGSNVLVSATGVAKLVDFGLARVDAEKDRSGRLQQPRTIDYATLEKLGGVQDDDVRSDIYFLGAIAYLAFAGVPALAETRDREARANPRRFTGVRPLSAVNPNLPRDVVEFVTRMMHLDPRERLQTAAEAKQTVDRVAALYASGRAVARSAHAPGAAPVAQVATRGSVMVVEASESGQQALRECFTKLGFRVLVTESPQRALARFSDTPLPANCLVVCSRTLGRPAVEAFNALSEVPQFATVPAVLLADPRQTDLLGMAKTDGLRRLVPLPIQADGLGRIVDELIAGPAAVE
jgi:serine/threonine-protein kinase